MENIDDEWESFLSNELNNLSINDKNEQNVINSSNDTINNRNIDNIPKSSPIYISTKTKISYLNKNSIDIKKVFWEIPIINYSSARNGIVKKQIKFSSSCKEDVDIINNNLSNVKYHEEHIIEHIENPQGRIKYKDQRKISIGISKKDILSYRSKKKRAFFNCFVIILRILINDEYKEMHIKVFNTGKLEIPGIQKDSILDDILILLIDILKPYIGEDLNYIKKKNRDCIN